MKQERIMKEYFPHSFPNTPFILFKGDIQHGTFLNLWNAGICSYSFISNGETLADNNLNLNSESAILIDAKTGGILYEKNSRKTMYPAIITKIVTGIIALKQGNPEDTVTVSEKARNAHGTRVYLLEGEKVPLKN